MDNEKFFINNAEEIIPAVKKHKGIINKFMGDENHNFIRNFVPCERFSDSTCGWYDTVNRQFYPAEITEKGDYIPEEGSSSNYDYYEESDMYLCVKSNKKGQVLHT